MEIKMETQMLTFKELKAIEAALFVALETDPLIDVEPIKEALHKIDYVVDKYCRSQQHNVFAFLPLLAESDEE